MFDNNGETSLSRLWIIEWNNNIVLGSIVNKDERRRWKYIGKREESDRRWLFWDVMACAS
jgi:hypothetical protein